MLDNTVKKGRKDKVRKKTGRGKGVKKRTGMNGMNEGKRRKSTEGEDIERCS